MGPSGWTALAVWLLATIAILLFIRFWRVDED
jgi:hypothetical protein